MGREISGTDAQIASRIRRGDHVRAIRDELGCGSHRINRVAEAEGLTVMRAHRHARMDEGQITLKADTRKRIRPNVRVTLPEGWTTVHLTYPDNDDGVIEIRKVKA